MAWDLAVFNWIHGLAGWSVFTDTIGVFSAKYLAYLLGLAALFLVLKREGWKNRMSAFFHVTLAALISRGILTELIRYFYDRPRPFVSLGFSPLAGGSGASLPSGHAALLFALGFAIFAVDRRWGYWFLSLSFVNGLARIFVGVHYPTDVLAGIIVGFFAWKVVRLLIDGKTTVPENEPKT